MNVLKRLIWQFTNPISLIFPLGKEQRAITLFPFIIYFTKAPTVGVILHEEWHWKQQRRCLVIPWFIAYGLLAIFYGTGRNHPMEIYGYTIQYAADEGKVFGEAGIQRNIFIATELEIKRKRKANG